MSANGKTLAPFVAQPSRYSMSTLRASERCLLAARMAREADPAGEYAVVGRIAHEIFAAVSQLAVLRGQEYVGEAEALAIAERVLSHPEEPNPLSHVAVGDIREMVRRFAARVTFNPKADVWAAELPMRHRLGRHTLSARLDRLEIDGGVADIIDYKTGPAFPTQDAVNADIQLRIYAWHVAMEYPEVEGFILRQFNARHGRMLTMDPPLGVEDVELFEDWMIAAAARLEAAWAADDFPPTPGSWCATCPAPNRCPLPRDFRPASITDDDEAVRQFEALLVEEADVKRRKDAIKAYMEANGIEAIGTADREMVRSETTQKRLDKKALEAAGVDVAAFEREAHRVEFKTKARK